MESQISEEKCNQNIAQPSTTHIPKNSKREFSKRGRNFMSSSNVKYSATINKGGSFYKNHHPNGKTNRDNRYRGNPSAFENKNIKEKFSPLSGNSYNYQANRFGSHRSSSLVVFNFKEGKKNNYKSMDMLTNTQNQNYRQNQKKNVHNNKNINTSKERNMPMKTNAVDTYNKMVNGEGYTMMDDQFPELSTAGIKKNKKKKKKGDTTTSVVTTVEQGINIHNSNEQESIENKTEEDVKKTDDMINDTSEQTNNPSNETQNVSEHSPQKPSGATTKKKKKRKKKNSAINKTTITENTPNTVEENSAIIVKTDTKSLNMDAVNLNNNESIGKEEQSNTSKEKKEEDKALCANVLHETQNDCQNINEKLNDNMNIQNIPLPMEGSNNNAYEKNYHMNMNEINHSMNYMHFNDANNNINNTTNNNMYNVNYMNDYNSSFLNMMKNDFAIQAVHNLKNQGGKFDNELNNNDSYAMNATMNLYHMFYMNMYNRLHQFNDFSNTNKSAVATNTSVEGNVRNESNPMNTLLNFNNNENVNPCTSCNMENLYNMNAHFNQLLEYMNRNPDKYNVLTHYTHNNDKQMLRYYGNSPPRGGKFNSNFSRVKYRNANYDFSRKVKNDPLGTNRNYMDRKNFIGNTGGDTETYMIMGNRPNKNEQIMQMNNSSNPHGLINLMHAYPNINNTTTAATTTTTTNTTTNNHNSINNNNNNTTTTTVTKSTKNKNKNKNKSKELVVDPKEMVKATETVEVSNNKKSVTVPIESSTNLFKKKNKKVNSANFCKQKLIDAIPEKDVKENNPFRNIARMLEDGKVNNKGSAVCVEPDMKMIENNNVINTEIYKFIEDCVKCIGDDAFMSLIDEFSNNAAPTNEKMDELKEIFDISIGGNEIDPKALEELKKGNEKSLLLGNEKGEPFEESNEIKEEKNNEVDKVNEEEKEKEKIVSETKNTLALPPGLSIPNINKALLHGAYLDRITFVKECIEKKADVNYSDKVGRTALHYACAGGYYEVCEFLIKSGAKVNIADYKNWTPLHIAVTKMHKEIAELLLKNQANIYALLPHALPPNRGKRTLSMSIHYAAIKGDKEMTKLLIEYGANVDDLDKADRTPLHYAACRKNSDYVKFLITELKAKVNVFDTHNRLPIHSACLGGNLENVKILLENGSMVEKLDIFNMSPTDIAGMKNFHQIARFLRKFTRENYTPEIIQGEEKKQDKEEEREGEVIEDEDKNNDEHRIMDPKEFFNDNEKIKEALVSTTSVVLKEKNARQIKRVVDALGVYVSLFLLQKTCLIKNYGGMARDDKQGRRTSGGVYFFLIKYMYRQNIISRFKYDYIFEEEKEKKKTYRKLKKKLLQEEENKNSRNVEVKTEEVNQQKEQEKKQSLNQRENCNSIMKCKGKGPVACNSAVVLDVAGNQMQTENLQNGTNGTYENSNTLKKNGTNGTPKNTTTTTTNATTTTSATKKKGAKLISAGTSTDHGYINKSEIQGKGDSKNALVQTSKKLLASITNKNVQGKPAQITNISGKSVLKNEKGVGPLNKPLKINKTTTTGKESGEHGKLLYDVSTNAYNILHQNKRFKPYNKKFLNNQALHNYPNYCSPYFNKNFHRKKAPFMNYQVKRNTSVFRGTLEPTSEQTAGTGGLRENDIQFINYQHSLQNQQMQHIQQLQQLQQMQQLQQNQQNGKKQFFNSNNGSLVQNENFKYPHNMNAFTQDFMNFPNGVNPYSHNFQNSRCFFPNDLRNHYNNYMNNANMCMMSHFYDMYSANNQNHNNNNNTNA